MITRTMKARQVVQTKWLRSALLVASLSPSIASAAMTVTITSPAEEAVFGKVAFAVTVAGERPARVELRVDGKSAGTLTQPPFRVEVQVGDDNVEHVFEATAFSATGQAVSARRMTPRLQIDEQVDLALQQLFVTVADGERRVPGLERRDFRVSEDGRSQDIVTFESGEVPLTAALLLDSSESMRGPRLEAAVRGARLFVAGMKELDEAMLLLFSDRLLRATPFTDDPEVIAAALPEIEALGGTAVNDHLYLALNRLDERQGRRVVILFSDGADVLSVLRMEEVLWKVARSSAIVYWIRLEESGRNPRTSFTSTWRGAPENTREFEQLEEAVRVTGGRVQILQNANQIESAFGDVLRELRDQYVIGYYSNRAKKGLRRIQVDLRGFTGYRVRTRESYIAD